MAEWLRRWTANPLGSARAGSNPVIVDFFRDTMAEWLRRLTRNQLGSARVGSNPTGVDLFPGHLLVLLGSYLRHR